MKKIQCKKCNKFFPQKTYNQKFCSIKCKMAFYGYKHKYKNVCQFCNKEFNPNRRNQKFCSRECGVRGRVGKTKRNSAMKYNMQCAECGIPFYRKPHRLKINKNQFCSMACAANHRRKIYQGKSNPNYQNIPPKICKGCGRAFFAYNKRRQYCSRECSYINSDSIALINLKKGLEAELWCKKELEFNGYTVTRSNASRGDYDIIAFSSKKILLIQVKRTISKIKSRVFMKKDINKLRKAIIPESSIVNKQLWTWVDGIGWEILEVKHVS